MTQAQQQAFTWIGQQVQMPDSFPAYIDVFRTLLPVSAAAVPLTLTMRKVRLGAGAPIAH